jgi:hypothetical protein
MKKLLVWLLGAIVGIIMLTLLLFPQKNPGTEKLTPKLQSPAEKLPDLKYYDGDDLDP